MQSPYKVVGQIAVVLILLFAVFAIFGGAVGATVGLYLCGGLVSIIVMLAPVLCWCELRTIRMRMDDLWPPPAPAPEPVVNPPTTEPVAQPSEPAEQPYVSRNPPSPMDHVPDSPA